MFFMGMCLKCEGWYYTSYVRISDKKVIYHCPVCGDISKEVERIIDVIV